MTTRLMRTTAIRFTRRFSTAARHLLAPRPSTKTCAQRDGRPEAIATLHATLFTGAVAASSAAARRRASRPTGEHVPHDGHYLAYIALPLGAKPPLAPGDIPAKAPCIRIGQPAAASGGPSGRLVAIRHPRSPGSATPVLGETQSETGVYIAAAHQEQERRPSLKKY